MTYPALNLPVSAAGFEIPKIEATGKQLSNVTFVLSTCRELSNVSGLDVKYMTVLSKVVTLARAWIQANKRPALEVENAAYVSVQQIQDFISDRFMNWWSKIWDGPYSITLTKEEQRQLILHFVEHCLQALDLLLKNLQEEPLPERPTIQEMYRLLQSLLKLKL